MLKRALTNGWSTKLKSIFASLLLVIAQIGPVVFLPAQASAATLDCTTVDLQGPNDEPGQKDLNLLCDAIDDVPGEKTVGWNWDEIAWTGANTGDACALFDTDGDDNANYSVCVTVSGDPASQTGISPRIYMCNDDRPDRCSGAVQQTLTNTSCSVTSNSPTDPFSGPAKKNTGSAYPNDTRATCVIDLDEVGGGVAELTDVCSFPSQQPNSDPSDCIITPTGKSEPIIELTKLLSPVNDEGLFDLTIDQTIDTVVTDVSNGGSTGEVTYDGATTGPDAYKFVIKEEPGSNLQNLDSYTTQVTCADALDLGNPFFNQSRTGSLSRSATISIPNNVEKVNCVFVNTRKSGSVKVIKDVVNDNGGTKTYADFTFQNNGGSAKSFVETTSPDGEKVLSLPVGSTFSISEVEANTMGYATSYSGTCSGTVTEVQQTCTITNNDVAPSLTLVKNPINNNGGNAQPGDFNITVAGNTVTSGAKNSYNAGVPLAINETMVNGYSFVSITGDAKCPAALGGTVTLALQDDITCTINNDDIAPILKLQKKVVNDNGGTLDADDFGISIAGFSPVVFGAPVSSNGSMSTYESSSQVSSNTEYTISENDVNGYSEGTWVCKDANLVQVAMGSYSEVKVTLNEGDEVTCTITNDDIAPQLTLVKIVTNDDGGTEIASAWTLIAQAGQDAPIINEQGTVDPQDDYTASTNTVDVEAGIFYALSESGPNGYTPSNWSCDGGTQVENTIQLALSAVVTCTITNDDQPATLILIKHLPNDNGGNETEDDFAVYINRVEAQWGSNTVNAGTYYVGEKTLTGYTPSDWGTDCNAEGQVTLLPGETKTCDITNDDVAPILRLKKTVINDDGGTLDADDFGIAIEGSSNPVFGLPTSIVDDTSVYMTSMYRTANVDINISEADTEGYSEGTWSCDNGVNGTGLNVTVNLNEGDDVTCEITNDDIAPELGVGKRVLNDDGGTKFATDFTLRVNGGDPIEFRKGGGEVEDNIGIGPYLDAKAGISYSITEDFVGGYNNLGVVCTDRDTQQVVAHPVVLSLAQRVECIITNEDIAPTLTLKKVVANDQGGDYEADSWILRAYDDDDASYVIDETGVNTSSEGSEALTSTVDVVAGEYYTLSEYGPYGYDASDWDCDGGVQQGNVITMALDEDVTCTVTNDDIAPTLTVFKRVINDHSGEKSVEDFNININGDALDFDDGEVDGTQTDFMASPIVKANTLYALGEDDVDGYDEGIWVCKSSREYTIYGTYDEINLELGLAEDMVCYISNDDTPNPSINVVKEGPATAVAGQKVTYTFTVTNTGDIALENVKENVKDDIAGPATYVSGDTNDDDILDLDETWIFNVEYTIPLNQIQPINNTVTACGYAEYTILELNDFEEVGEYVQLVRVQEFPERYTERVVEISDCDEDSHTTTIPQVLAVATPVVLAQTGEAALTSVMFGMMIISTVGILVIADRRKN